MYFFIPSVRPCMHYHNYDVISGSHAYRDCVRPTIFGAGLYNLPWEASVSSHQVQYNTPAFEALLRKNVHLFLEQCRQSNNVWLHALMQSDCLYSSLFFEHYNCILLCHWVLGRYSVSLCMPHHSSWPWPGLDSLSYSEVVLYQVLWVSEQ